MPRKVWKRKKGADLNIKLNDKHHLKNKQLSATFRNIETHLIEFIEGSESVVCCVAWLTKRFTKGSESLFRESDLVMGETMKDHLI